MNWSGEMIFRRYGITLNIKRPTIEHNEHRDMILLQIMGIFHAYPSSLTILRWQLCDGSLLWLCNRISAQFLLTPLFSTEYMRLLRTTVVC